MVDGKRDQVTRTAGLIDKPRQHGLTHMVDSSTCQVTDRLVTRIICDQFVMSMHHVDISSWGIAPSGGTHSQPLLQSNVWELNA